MQQSFMHGEARRTPGALASLGRVMGFLSTIAGWRIRPGSMVEVLSAEEIFATLDDKGCIDGMPFMPEMLKYCGRQYRVAMSAHKTCDTIHYKGNMRMHDTVHLEGLRCDGAAHGGCQAMCLFFWKKAWLKPAGSRARRRAAPGRAVPFNHERLQALTQRDPQDGEVRYVCQVTEIPRASKLWPWWRPDQYVVDILSGNWSIGHVFSVLALAVLRKTIPVVRGYRIQMFLYRYIARKTGRDSYFDIIGYRGSIPVAAPTPQGTNTFKPGDWVRVKKLPEISSTLSVQGKNRGLFFDAEMVPYCGRKFRVSGLVTRLIEESTGRMTEMRNPCIALEGVVCRGEYSVKRLMCPRSIVPVWRPLWLEHAEAEGTTASEREQ